MTLLERLPEHGNLKIAIYIPLLHRHTRLWHDPYCLQFSHLIYQSPVIISYTMIWFHHPLPKEITVKPPVVIVDRNVHLDSTTNVIEV